MSESPPAPAPKKEIIATPSETPAEEFADDPPEPAPHYGEAKIWLIARDPHCLFAYWEFRPEEHPAATGEDRARLFLRVFCESGKVVTTVDIATEKGNAFVPAMTPDSGCFAEVGFFTGQIWCFLARSGIARTPPALEEESPAPQFATIPAAVSLTKLRDVLAPVALPDEKPASTAARIEAEARRHEILPPGSLHVLGEILAADEVTAVGPPLRQPTVLQKVRRKLASTAAAASPSAKIVAPECDVAPASSSSQHFQKNDEPPRHSG